MSLPPPLGQAFGQGLKQVLEADKTPAQGLLVPGTLRGIEGTQVLPGGCAEHGRGEATQPCNTATRRLALSAHLTWHPSKDPQSLGGGLRW